MHPMRRLTLVCASVVATACMNPRVQENMAQAMTDMIEVQRSFQMTSKALTMADQMAEIANGVKR